MKFEELSLGDRVQIQGFHPGHKDYRQRLMAMGLTRGTEFSVLRYAPLGDPVEIEVRGFSLALRKAEASILIIERVQA